MPRSLVFLFFLAFTFPLLAQTPTRMDAGVAIGQQYYENYSKRRTFEFGYHTGNTEVFARVRQYEYALSGFRTRNSPKGPAFSLGLRFNLH